MGEIQHVTEAALLHRIADEQAERRLPSLVAAVVRDGEIVWFGGRGRVGDAAPSPDTQYRIGSITKTFVGVQVMRLRDEGRVGLSDPLDKFVPGTPLGDRTIGQLLSHTAGLTAESPGDWWERTPGLEWPKFVDTLTPEIERHRAARRFHYSNLGFGFLGELVARLRGASWADTLRAEILKPLGLRRTTFEPTAPHAWGWAVHPYADILIPEPAYDAGAMAPAGQLWASTEDLARWVAFLGGDVGDVLNPDTLAEMREPVAVEDADEWRGGYGLGLQLARPGKRRLVGHGGSMPGFVAGAWADPGEGLGALFMANTTSGVRGGVCTDLLDIVSAHEPRLPEEWLPQYTVDNELLVLTGTWFWGPRPYMLRLLGDGLLDLSPVDGRGRASRFRPEDDGTFIGLDGYYVGEKLRVVRNPDGTVRHLDLATFLFSREPYASESTVDDGRP